MAAIVYNGAIRGTGNHVVQTLYENTTGGNVRVLWNWLTSGATDSDDDRKIFYGPTPTFSGSYINSGDLTHTSGNNLDVIGVEVGNNFTVGKDLAFHVQSQNTYHKMVDHVGAFPLEIMLANTHKVMLWTKDSIATDDVAIVYNFVVIPENG